MSFKDLKLMIQNMNYQISANQLIILGSATSRQGKLEVIWMT